MKKYKIVNKIRFYLFLIFIIFFSFVTLTFIKSFGRVEGTVSNLKYEEIYIDMGDTVWDIALKYKSEQSDVRDMVAEIRDFNNLEDLSIKQGDIIRIPNRKK